jgi:hypothetical protein
MDKRFIPKSKAAGSTAQMYYNYSNNLLPNQRAIMHGKIFIPDIQQRGKIIQHLADNNCLRKAHVIGLIFIVTV